MPQSVIDNLKIKYSQFQPYFNERSLRIWVAIEARAIGHGGKLAVKTVTGLTYATLKKGSKELDLEEDKRVPINRKRKVGGGRKKLRHCKKTTCHSPRDKVLDKQVYLLAKLIVYFLTVPYRNG